MFKIVRKKKYEALERELARLQKEETRFRLAQNEAEYLREKLGRAEEALKAARERNGALKGGVNGARDSRGRSAKGRRQ